MWNWSSGDNPDSGVQQNRPRAAYNANAASLPPAAPNSQSQLGYAQYPGYLTQPQTGGNFFYGYQGSVPAGYASYPNTRSAHTRYTPSYDSESQFAVKPRHVSAVSEVRKTDKSLKRKNPKQSNKPPILKRKDKRISDSSQTSSTYQVTSSPSQSPRSASPSSDSHLGGQDFAQESVLGRASFLVLNDYRSQGHQSIGSRSTKSRTSTAAIRDYRPSHVPEPVVPGFSFSSDEDDPQNRDHGKGYVQSIETTSLRSVNKQLFIDSDRNGDTAVLSHQIVPPPPPPPPPVIPPQPIYATVNKDNKTKPSREDPIYSTIEEAKKNLTKPNKPVPDSQPLSVLSELKQKFSLRSKAKALEFSDSHPDLTGNSWSHQSAFRPYNALKANTFKMEDAIENEYDMPIPIDKVLLKDGSEPSDLEMHDTETETGGVTDTVSNLSNTQEGTGHITPSNVDIYFNDGGKSGDKDYSSQNGEFAAEVVSEFREQVADMPVDNVNNTDGLTDNSTANAENNLIALPLATLAPVMQDQSSHISSVLTQSNFTTQSSTKSSQRPVLHQPITSANFQPKGILKNKAGRDDSSSSESSSEESDDESERHADITKDENDKYHLTIPVEVSEPTAEVSEAPTLTHPEPEKVGPIPIPTNNVRPVHKFASVSSLHSSLRAARHASQSSLEADAKQHAGVSFTQDTRDNEGIAKKYEQDGLNLSKIYKGKISSKSAIAKPNPLFNASEEDQVDKITPEPPTPVHQAKHIEPKRQVEPTQPPLSLNTKPRAETKDQSVATDNYALEVISASKLQNNNNNVGPNIEPDKVQEYSLVMKSPRGILKHPNGTATLQLNQPNQFVISAPDKCATLPNGALNIHTDLTGSNRSGGRHGSGGHSPSYKLVNQSPSYAVRHTGDNISVVSITGYDPAWETRSNYSTDTIRTLDDFTTGTIRTMVSLGTYSNPYMGTEMVGNDSIHYRKQISESSTDPLAFSMSYDSKMFDYQLQNKMYKQNGGPMSKPHRHKKRETKAMKPEKKPSQTTTDSEKGVQKKTTFADHALGYDALFRKEKKKKRKRRCIKIVAMLLVLAVVIITISLVIFFLTDKDNKQDNATGE